MNRNSSQETRSIVPDDTSPRAAQGREHSSLIQRSLHVGETRRADESGRESDEDDERPLVVKRRRVGDAALYIDDAPYLPTRPDRPPEGSKETRKRRSKRSQSSSSQESRDEQSSRPSTYSEAGTRDYTSNPRATETNETHHIHATSPPARPSGSAAGQQPPIYADYSNRYPAYDTQARRIGLEHVRFNSVPHEPTDGMAYYRPQTRMYPVQNAGPRVMNITLAPANPVNRSIIETNRNFAAQSSSGTGGTRVFQHEQPPAISPIHTPSPLDASPSPFPLPFASTSHPPSSVGSSQSGSQEDADPDPQLRQLLGLGPNEEVSLWSLIDPPRSSKPNYPYPTLIKLAIQGSPQKRLTLQGIYAALEDRFQWYREHSTDKAWQNSIRHNLSLNKCFRQVPKPVTEPGKGNYWVVDYSQGEGNKRPRKRNKRPTKAELRRRQEEAASPSPERSSSGGAVDTSGEEQNEDACIDPQLRDGGRSTGMGLRGQSSTMIAPVRHHTSTYAPEPPSAGSSQSRAPSTPSATIAPRTIRTVYHNQMADSPQQHPRFVQTMYAQPQAPPARLPPISHSASYEAPWQSAQYNPGILRPITHQAAYGVNPTVSASTLPDPSRTLSSLPSTLQTAMRLPTARAPQHFQPHHGGGRQGSSSSSD